jgi:isopenicillin-N epimerase
MKTNFHSPSNKLGVSCVTSPLRLSRRAVFAGVGALLVDQAVGAELPVSSRELWGWVRAQQVLEPQLTYLDTATFGPALRSALVAEYRDQEVFNSDAESYRRSNFSVQAVTALADRVATLINADTREVAITRGATEALNAIANGIDLQAGDEVVLTSHAHPASLAPWQLRAARQGVVIKQVPLPSPLEDGAQALGLIASVVTDRTRVIACSHLQHTDGAVLPVRDICTFARQRNILSVIDGAQAVGCIDVDTHGIDCDFYAGSLHKWFNGPAALGLLYVRHDRLDSLWPLQVNSSLGWRPDESSNIEVDEVAEQRRRWPLTWRKYSWDTRWWGPQLKALDAAFEFRSLLSAGRIESRIRELAIYARLRLQEINDLELLTPPQPGMWAGIITFRLKRGSAIELAQRLTRNDRIVVSAIQHPVMQSGALRASFHIYNSHDDVDRLVNGVQKYI